MNVRDELLEIRRRIDGILAALEPEDQNKSVGPKYRSHSEEMEWTAAKKTMNPMSFYTMLRVSGLEYDTATVKELVRKMSLVHLQDLRRKKNCGTKSIEAICKFVRDRGGRVQGDGVGLEQR